MIISWGKDNEITYGAWQSTDFRPSYLKSRAIPLHGTVVSTSTLVQHFGIIWIRKVAWYRKIPRHLSYPNKVVMISKDTAYIDDEGRIERYV